MARKKPSGLPASSDDSAAVERVQRIERWRSRAAVARQIREQWERDQRVLEGERYYLGQQRLGGQGPVFNHFAGAIKADRPSLFYQAPKFYVRAKPGRRLPNAELTARIGEGVLQAIGDQDEHLEAVGQLALLQGYFRCGVLKVVYDPRMVPNPKAGEPMVKTDTEGAPILEDGATAPLLNPLTGEVIREPDEVLTDEVYRWAWVDAANMLLPDEGPDPAKWTWIGEEVTTTLEAAKADLRFPKDVRDSLRANRTTSRSRSGQRKRSRGDEDLFEWTELYDLRNARWLILADGQLNDGVLLDEPVPAWIDKHPYALLMMGEPIIGPEPSPWPYPVVADWIDVQEEYNIRRRQTTEGAKRSARKILFEDGAFPDEEEARKMLQSSNDMEAVKVTNIKGVLPISDPNLSQVIYQDLGLLMTDFRGITGQPGARQSDPSGVSATEASLVERQANLRDSDAQRKVTRWMSEAGRKMFQCVKQTLTLGLWIELQEIDDSDLLAYLERVYGVPKEMISAVPGLKEIARTKLGRQKWMHVTRQSLIFEADVTVVPGSTRPLNLDVERRQWLDFLRVLGAAPQLALSRELLRYTAEKFDIHDDRMLDELGALAERMVGIQQKVAGRDQGSPPGALPTGQQGGPADMVNALLSTVTGGAR
jgi:hypothetical protein